MKRVKLVVAYDGTNYHGWQLQPNGISIEAVLNDALSSLLREPITVIGASRTDSGVHALGNVAVFDTENRMPADKICFALNQRLPEDIRIQSSGEVPLDWHPRKQNCVKTYEYKILNRKVDMPVGRLYSYFCYFPVDVEAMRRAALFLVGEHDFKSFCTVRTQAEETVRTIYQLEIQRDNEDVITLRIAGSGFLYNMVRIIAGTLLRVGTGLYPPEHVEEILEARNRQAAGPTLPAKGLTLVHLAYETELAKVIEGKNKHWAYRLIQAEIREKKKAYLIIDRCCEEDFERLLIRVTHQAVRNGARQVFVCDKEADNRIVVDKPYGYYTFSFAHAMVEMRKKAGCGSGAVYGEEKQKNGGKIILAEDLELRAVQQEEIPRFCGKLNETFYEVPNSATLEEEEVRAWFADRQRYLYWMESRGKTAGVLVLWEKEDGLMVDSIAVAEEYRKRGFARKTLTWCEGLAEKLGKEELLLWVSSSNLPACRLYQRMGFLKEKTISRWLMTKEQWKGEEE